MFTFFGWIFISDSGGGFRKCLIHMLLKENLNNDSTASTAMFWTPTSSRNGSEKELLEWKKPKALNSGKSLHISSNMRISLKPPRLWVGEATMIHLATTIWNLTDLGCLFPKKTLKVWPYIESEPNLFFSNSSGQTSQILWQDVDFSVRSPFRGVPASWSSCLGTGKPSQIDPLFQWPKTRWCQLKYFWNFQPENWGRWTHFDEHIFQRGWNSTTN